MIFAYDALKFPVTSVALFSGCLPANIMARVLCYSVSLLDSETKRNKGDGVCRENIIMQRNIM